MTGFNATELLVWLFLFTALIFFIAGVTAGFKLKTAWDSMKRAIKHEESPL